MTKIAFLFNCVLKAFFLGPTHTHTCMRACAYTDAHTKDIFRPPDFESYFFNQPPSLLIRPSSWLSSKCWCFHLQYFVPFPFPFGRTRVGSALRLVPPGWTVSKIDFTFGDIFLGGGGKLLIYQPISCPACLGRLLSFLRPNRPQRKHKAGERPSIVFS